MKFTEFLKDNIVVLDGAMGTQLQARGLSLGELPEEWNLSRAEDVEKVHREYLAAGADVVYTNTFGANCLKFGERTESIVAAGVECAKRAASMFTNKFVALDVGPTGKLLQPIGDLPFEKAVEIFARTIKAGVAAGADLIAIETMNDTYELKAAVLAAKEFGGGLPIIATCVFGSDCKMMTGASPEAAVALLEGLGVDAIGLNCSLGPKEMTGAVERFLKCASVPVVVKPNAGLPEEREGRTVYNVSAEEFARSMKKLVEMGARVIGGCCGTTPEYISFLAALKGQKPVPVTEKSLTCVSSYTHAVYFGGAPIIIGERINPTGKKRLKAALRDGDMAYLLGEAVTQAENGAHVLDVNVGLPEIDEPAVLERAVAEIQAVTDLPLQIDTSDPAAMERAMRRYNGKPLVNSVNGKKEVMDAVFPLVKKYGGAVIALTLDENGIPPTAEGRIKIAEKIIAEAEKYSIKKCDLIFDTLAMAISADTTAARAALDSLRYLRHSMGVNTSLGVSNISFGLPERDFINGTFFAMALESGLSAAILNPLSQEMTKTYKSFCALSGYDENCLKYIEYASAVTREKITVQSAQKAVSKEDGGSLRYCVEKGLKAEAEAAAARLLKDVAPLDVINGEIIPALDEVGKAFENKTLFLPQLLMSAEAASGAFDVIKRAFNGGGNSKKLKIVIATVKGDIHDIGKNIVRTLLENYGFTVYDLGRDVPARAIVDKAKEVGAQVVGLSALMTTTVASMKETIELLKAEYPSCRTLVGGAVLNREYAEMIGATKYAKDAMESVRYCEELENQLF